MLPLYFRIHFCPALCSGSVPYWLVFGSPWEVPGEDQDMEKINQGLLSRSRLPFTLRVWQWQCISISTAPVRQPLSSWDPALAPQTQIGPAVPGFPAPQRNLASSLNCV